MFTAQIIAAEQMSAFFVADCDAAKRFDATEEILDLTPPFVILVVVGAAAPGRARFETRLGRPWAAARQSPG